MRQLAALFAIFALAEMGTAHAKPDVDAYGTGAIKVVDHSSGPQEPEGNASVAKTTFAYRFVAIVEGTMCWKTGTTTDEAEARAFQYAYRNDALVGTGLDGLPQCPAEAAAVAPPTPGELARDFWDVRRLPSPTLRVVPDDAIVGKRVYLQIHGPPTTTFDVPNPIGADIAIDARSAYLVDWGDGSPPATTTSQGGPWPHGDVTHVYDTASPSVVIRVTQQWSATWTAGTGAAGTLEHLQTVGELTIRVDQLQPVRNR